MKYAPGARYFVGISSLCLLLSLPAMADSLYTNGPINGNANAVGISYIQEVSDSFGLGSASTIGSISFGAWVLEGDAPLKVSWSISSAPAGGTIYASGTSSLTNSLFCTKGPSCGLNQYDVYNSAFSTNVSLGPGSYYLTLSNATTVKSNGFDWDENDGIGCSGVGCPSSAYVFINGIDNGPIASESFSLYAVPDSGTLDLLGIGAFASLGLKFNGRVLQKLFWR